MRDSQGKGLAYRLGNGFFYPGSVFFQTLGDMQIGNRNGEGRAAISDKVRDELSKLFYEETKRRPMIIPTIVEV